MVLFSPMHTLAPSQRLILYIDLFSQKTTDNHLSLQEQQRGKRGGLGQENVFNILGIGSQVLDLKPDPKQPLIRFVKQGTKPKVKRLNTKKTFEEPEIIKEKKSIKRKRESKQINGNTSKKVKKKKSISNGHITSSVEISKTIVSSKSSITEISSIKNIISMNVRIKKLKLKDERKLKKITLLHFHSDTFFIEQMIIFVQLSW
eukprot:snap_masked-scaffold_4-processed-gene-3.33-mRNA-1 protein AED:1.00 eAED:1.00 QI:0/0/0/0/1/1/2/0/202